MSSSGRVKKAERLVKERVEIKNAISEIESKLFKIEDEYLELTQGVSLFRNLEFYIHTKPEKKKAVIEEGDRVFASDFPRQECFK